MNNEPRRATGASDSTLAPAPTNNDASVRVLITAAGEETRCTLAEFLEANADGLGPLETKEIRETVLAGGCYSGGGGAAAMYDIELDPCPPTTP